MNFQFFLGKVVSITDTDNKGKIQVKPYPLMTDIPDADCPWVRPFLATATNETYINIPPVSSLVWIMDFDNFVHNSFYLPYSTLDGLIDMTNDIADIGTATGLSMGTSSDITYHKTEDGTVTFRNKKTGVLGLVHKSGSYVTIAANGDIKIVSEGSITVEGDVTMTNGKLATGAGASAIPNGTGAFLGVHNCLYAGAPISGNEITGT